MSVAPLPPLTVSRAPHEAARPLRIAVVGAGAMGKRHVRVLASRADRFELVAVMDVDARAAAEVARAHGVDPVIREADAIARADALVVATPALAHALCVRRAVAAGRHVLVEKPIAGSAREAQELVALAESRGVHLCVGHSERFNPVVRALARLVEPGSVESLACCRVGSARNVDGRKPGEPGEGALVNLGVHDFDLAAYLARSPVIPTRASRASRDPAHPGAPPSGSWAPEDRADVLARTESGARVSLQVDQRPVDGLRRRSITVTTPTHLWQGNLLVPSLVRTCRLSGVREAIPLDTEEPLLAQAHAFLAVVRGGPPNEIATGHDGMCALRVAELARHAGG